MSEALGAGVIRVSADATELKAGIEDAKRSVRSLGGALGDSVQSGSASAQRSISAYIQSLERSAANVGKTRSEIKLLELTQRGATDAQLEAARAAFATLDAYKAQEAATRRLNVAQIETDALMKRLGVSTGQYNAALRTVPAQFTDIATQLAGGQNPLLILLQQGGQLKDSFGGIKPALAGLTSFITPLTVGLGALAATVVGLGFEIFKTADQSEKLARSLVLSGNFAGTTASQYESLARSVAASAGVSRSAANDAVQGLIATGDVGPRLIRPLAEAVALTVKVTGEAADKTVADFAKMSDGVAKWAAEHNKSLNFINAATYERIRALEEEGKKEAAQTIVIAAYTAKMDAAAQVTGFWAGRIRFLAGELDVLGESIRRAVLPNLGEQIASLDRQLAARQKLASVPFGAGTVGVDGTAQKQNERNALAAAQEGEQVAAVMNAASAATNKAGIAASDYFKKLRDGTKGLDLTNEKLREYRRNVEAAAKAGTPVTAAQQAIDEAEIRSKNKGPADAAGNKAASLAKTQAQEYERLVISIKEKIAVSDLEIAANGRINAADKTRLEAIAAIDKLSVKLSATQRGEVLALLDTQRARTLQLEGLAQIKAAQDAAASAEQASIAAIEAVGQARTAENRGIAEQIGFLSLNAREIENLRIRRVEEALAVEEGAIAIAKATGASDGELIAMRESARLLRTQIELRQQLAGASARREDDPSSGVGRAIKEYNDEISKKGNSTFTQLKDGVKGLEDRLADFFVKGKADWVGYFQAIALEQAKTQIIKPLISGGLDLAKGALSSYFSGGGFGAFFGGGRAWGGPVSAGGIYAVNERGGPGELLTSGGKTYLMANQNGTVTPQSESAGTSVSYNIDARGADAGVEARVMRAIQQVQRSVPAQVVAAANRGGSVAKAVGRR